jgi:hypothetical protein
MTTTHNSIDWTRLTNDINGNPRYVCHFFNILTESEKHKDFSPDKQGIDGAVSSLDKQYKLALNRAKKLGGRKYHNKQYGGGIVFQSHNIKETEKQILDLLNK